MRKLLGVLGGIILVGIGLIIGTGFFLSPQDELKQSDAIVAVSGGETNQRVAEAVKLYKQDYAPIIIMSGAARDSKISNAEVMKRMAVSAGVPADKIITEDAATNTVENALNVRNIIEQHKFNRIILVTSPYHQRRAHTVFAQALKGLPVTIINHSSTDSAWRKNGWWKNAWAVRITFSEIIKTIYISVVPLAQRG